MKLRYYQEECLVSMEIAWGEYQRILIQLGTGAGKGVIAGSAIKTILEDPKCRCLYIADSDELCMAPLEFISRIAGVIPSLEKASSRASLLSRAVVASSQTLAKVKNLERFPRDHFTHIFDDEAHRNVVAESKIHDYFETALVCGQTATPFRTGVQDLAKWYPCVAYSKPMLNLIAEGFAPPWEIVTLPIEIDLAGVKVKQKFGEKSYDDEETAHKIEPWFEEIAKKGKSFFKGRHGIAFLPLKSSSEKFAQICREQGIIAVHVAGDSANREEIIESFRMGRIELLCNAGVMSTGVDVPIADLFLNLRLTKSLAYYQQAAGRTARVLPGVIDDITGEHQSAERRARIAASAKPKTLVLDLLWQHDSLGSIHAGHLISQDEEHAKAILKFTRKLRTPQDLIELAKKVQDEREEKLREALERAAAKSKNKLIDPLFVADLIKDDVLLRYHEIQAWELQPPSPAMLGAVEKFGINPDGVKTYGFAKKLIESMIFRSRYGLAHLKALRLLRQLHVVTRDPHHVMKNGQAWAILQREFKRRKDIPKESA